MYALLLALHAGPPATLPTLASAVAGGRMYVVVPTPADLRGGGRPVLRAAGGTSLRWIDRGEGLPTLEFVGPATDPPTTRFLLEYRASDGPRSVAVKRRAKPSDASGRTLERLGQTVELQVLGEKEAQSGGFSYFAFARAALARRYKLPDPGSTFEAGTPRSGGLFELTTGATALDESLALGRVPRTDHAPARRTLKVADVRGVTIAEHPWEKMMAGKRPRPEPLADAVPHDHWYFTATRLEKLAEATTLLDAWGGSALRAAQINDRDHALLDRYQTQLCLRIHELTRTVPAKLVRGVALTGSDLFWADGTDVTVIVETPDAAALLKALEPPVAATRSRLGDALMARSFDHRGVKVATLLTVDRSVARYQAVVGERVIVSNSKGAIRRVLDTVAGRRPALGQSLDFRYMRTVFERDPKQEDAFAFLSDAFIRTLVGPATRVKAMRRLDARSRLTALSHMALVYATRHGEYPVSLHRGFYPEYGLPVEALRVPEGRDVEWSWTEAASDVYGTLWHGTPLIDLPIDDVTPEEAAAYRDFREEYERLWRQFFDPVGLRFKLEPKEVRAEAYILPLVNASRYNTLRRVTAGKESSGDPQRLAPTLAGQARLSLGTLGTAALQLDDTAALAGWVEFLADWLTDPRGGLTYPADCPMYLLLPATDGDSIGAFLADPAAPPRLPWGVFDGPKSTSRIYEGGTIHRLPIRAKTYRGMRTLLEFVVGGTEDDSVRAIGLALLRYTPEEPPAAVSVARVGPFWCFGLDEKGIERRIAAVKAKPKLEGDPAALSLALTRRPGMTKALDAGLEARIRDKALSANAMWQALYDAKLVTPAMSEAKRRDVALRLWGFVPAAPDGSAAVLDPRTREVRNARHGTWARPATHAAPDPTSPLGKLVRSIEGVRADLRFREDGVHTTVTISRR